MKKFTYRIYNGFDNLVRSVDSEKEAFDWIERNEKFREYVLGKFYIRDTYKIRKEEVF